MTDNTQTASPAPAQSVIGEQEVPPVLTTQSAPQKQNFTSKRLLLIVTVLLGSALVVVTILYMRSLQSKEEPLFTPTPTAPPTPTPTPNVSRIATTSAFAAYSEEIASFSATLNSFTLQDSTLAPPILDLNIGLNE